MVLARNSHIAESHVRCVQCPMTREHVQTESDAFRLRPRRARTAVGERVRLQTGLFSFSGFMEEAHRESGAQRSYLGTGERALGNAPGIHGRAEPVGPRDQLTPIGVISL